MTAAQRKRLKRGDVLALHASGRLGYLHYIGKHSEYGEAVLVSPKLWDRQMTVASEIFSGGYVTFYPATAAIAHHLVEVVGHLPPSILPRRFRRPGAIAGSHVKTWIIEDGVKEVVKVKLSEDELRLPIATIWNHEYLVERLEEGWNPVDEQGEGES